MRISPDGRDGESLPRFFYAPPDRRRLGDASLARNGAGGIRFSGVRAARAENDVQNYFRGNDPFPTDRPTPGPLPFSLGSLLMKIITACSLFAWVQGVRSNLSGATSLRERIFERETHSERERDRGKSKTKNPVFNTAPRSSSCNCYFIKYIAGKLL